MGKTLRWWREDIKDMWNIVAVGGGVGNPAQPAGSPQANSHYGYHMVMWHTVVRADTAPPDTTECPCWLSGCSQLMQYLPPTPTGRADRPALRRPGRQPQLRTPPASAVHPAGAAPRLSPHAVAAASWRALHVALRGRRPLDAARHAECGRPRDGQPAAARHARRGHDLGLMNYWKALSNGLTQTAYQI